MSSYLCYFSIYTKNELENVYSMFPYTNFYNSPGINESNKALNIEILRLKEEIVKGPDPLELVKLQERDEGLNLLIEEKNRRIDDLTKFKEDISTFANYFKSHEPKLIEAHAAEKKRDRPKKNGCLQRYEVSRM